MKQIKTTARKKDKITVYVLDEVLLALIFLNPNDKIQRLMNIVLGKGKCSSGMAYIIQCPSNLLLKIIIITIIIIIYCSENSFSIPTLPGLLTIGIMSSLDSFVEHL